MLYYVGFSILELSNHASMCQHGCIVIHTKVKISTSPIHSTSGTISGFLIIFCFLEQGKSSVYILLVN